MIKKGLFIEMQLWLDLHRKLTRPIALHFVNGAVKTVPVEPGFGMFGRETAPMQFPLLQEDYGRI